MTNLNHAFPRLRQDSCCRTAHRSVDASGGQPQAKAFLHVLFSCLLLEPTSTSIGRGPSVLSVDRHAHPSSQAMQTVSAVAAIAYHAPGYDALRVTTICLQIAADHASQACSGQTLRRAACPLRFHPLTNAKFVLTYPFNPPQHSAAKLSLDVFSSSQRPSFPRPSVRLFLVPASVISSLQPSMSD